MMYVACPSIEFVHALREHLNDREIGLCVFDVVVEAKDEAPHQH